MFTATIKMIEAIGLQTLRLFEPEQAHDLALKALNVGLGPKTGPVTSDRLRSNVAGLHLPNPIGLAAGFDKNAESLVALSHTGFGFLEVGAATPLPQEGNPSPRVFRLKQDLAIINRLGFNNRGMVDINTRLTSRPKNSTVGLNLGANKTSNNRAEDYASVLKYCGPYIDFATVNVSSPNTEGLRNLQNKDELTELLDLVMKANSTKIPVFLKISPDLSDKDLEDIAYVTEASGIAGIVVSNTTLSRSDLTSTYQHKNGGLSGQPLFESSTRQLAKLSSLTDLPLIGVGGVGSPKQAYEKILAGASAVQLYTALVYSGISLASDIALGVDKLLERNGFANVAEAIGTGRSNWL
jgi:dihydroorotate dehydrogenase